jgi:hypothetical protein
MTLIDRLPWARPLLLVGAAVLMALALLTRPQWKRDTLPAASAPDGEEVREADLEQEVRDVHRRLTRKERVAQAVAAGRVTLWEAAAYFRTLNHQPPPFAWARFRAAWPGDSDDLRHCHEVIGWVYLTTRRTDARRAEAVRASLSAKLSGRLRRGPVRLAEISELSAFLDRD